MAQRPTDLRGQHFGRLTVLEPAPKRYPGERFKWMCQCACGTTKSIAAHDLKIGDAQSCGCYRREWNSRAHTKHGHYGTPEYFAWTHMIQRCEDLNSPAFPNYGGRGINVCPAWRHSFVTFFADMGPRPLGHSLDRINNDGHYEPTNCRWATAAKQANNRRPRRRR